MNYIKSLCIIFILNCFKYFETSWRKKSDKKIHTQFFVPKYFNTSILQTTNPYFYNPSVKIGSISFFSSFDIRKFHHLLACHNTGINSLHLLKSFAFFKFNMPSQKSDNDNSTRIIFITIIIKINIYIKNTNFTTEKHDITRIFIEVVYISICLQSYKNFFNHFTCNKSIKNKFQCY